MARILTLLAVALMVLSAFALYAVNYRTRELEIAAVESEQRRRELAADIAVLRAERAYLARPSRLEPLARQLGMAPLRGDQINSAPAQDAGNGRR